MFVNLLDLNDNDPTFQNLPFVAEVPEGTPAGVSVYQVSVPYLVPDSRRVAAGAWPQAEHSQEAGLPTKTPTVRRLRQAWRDRVRGWRRPTRSGRAPGEEGSAGLDGRGTGRGRESGTGGQGGHRGRAGEGGRPGQSAGSQARGLSGRGGGLAQAATPRLQMGLNRGGQAADPDVPAWALRVPPALNAP